MKLLIPTVWIMCMAGVALAQGGPAYAPASAVAASSAASSAMEYSNDPQQYQTEEVTYDVGATALNLLKQQVLMESQNNPHLFDPNDVQNFLNEAGAVAASRFLAQRSYNARAAAKLAVETLKWRKGMFLSTLKPAHFPCDLFELGLIFQYGQSRISDEIGQYGGNPVIWIRLGALSSIIKHLERPRPTRVLSFAHNTPRTAFSRLREKHTTRKSRRGYAVMERNTSRQRIIPNMAMKEHHTVSHVFRALSWWLDNWVWTQPPNAKATLVLDFENTDASFASWSSGDFMIKLDDHFPNLFDQVLGFRYKPKVWFSPQSYVSMLTRVFKSRVSSSFETDRKLKFISREPQIGNYIPRVDVNGYTMLPEHVSGECVGPDKNKAPVGCQLDRNANNLFDPEFWTAIFNEFYYTCKPKTRIV